METQFTTDAADKYRAALRELERHRAAGVISREECESRSMKIWNRIQRYNLFQVVVFGRNGL